MNIKENILAHFRRRRPRLPVRPRQEYVKGDAKCGGILKNTA